MNAPKLRSPANDEAIQAKKRAVEDPTRLSYSMRLICLELTDRHWLDVMHHVKVDLNAEVVYWSGAKHMELEVASRFPEVMFHDDLLAIRGVPPSGHDPGIKLVDEPLLQAMRETQSIALRMMERQDDRRNGFGYEDRLRHYIRLLAYWRGVLEKMKPDAVIMPIAPHLVFDYIAFGLCQWLGIPTILFDRTAVPGRVLMLNDFKGGSRELATAYARLLVEGKLAVLATDVEEYRERLRGDFSEGVAPNFKLKLERLNLAPKAGESTIRLSITKVALAETRAVVRHVLKNGFRTPRNYLVVPGVSPDKASIGFSRYHLSRWRGIWQKARLKALYNRLAKEPDYGAPYVFIALHYQPERNTVPVGGDYADQRLLISIIAATVPSGWQVYVKEHSWQLNPYSKGHLSRDTSFYTDIAAMPNVSLVPDNISSFLLIDNAKAVATVAGSVGWEAVNRGKPAMVFGDAWYQACEGVSRIRSRQDASEALALIAEGVIPDQRRVHLFLAALDEVAIRGVLEPRLEVAGGVSNEDNIRNFRAALVRRLSSIRQERIELVHQSAD